MPFIDITEVLEDPMVAGESFTVRRRSENIDQHGQVQITFKTYEGVGSIFPQGSPGRGADVLQRQADMQLMSKTIKVITTFRLQGPSQGYQPDTVIWNGDEFLVEELDDYTHYGAGFVEAQCSSIDRMDNPPA